MHNSALPCTPLSRRKKRPEKRASNPAIRLARESLTLDELRMNADKWLRFGISECHSKATQSLRSGIIKRLTWFLEHDPECHSRFCEESLQRFLLYCRDGNPTGERWPGCYRETQATSGTVATYYRHMRAFCNWLVAWEVLDTSPMRRLKPPIDRPDQVDPFSTADILKLAKGAATGSYSQRDLAIIYLLVDTGLRVSEMCSLQLSDLDLSGLRARVLGKGDKERTVFFSPRTARILFAYVSREGREMHEPLFASERGALTRSGVQQLLNRISKRIGMGNVHPHRFRHTFAVMFLRGGGDRGQLQMLLGHTDHRQTDKYVKFAQADIEQSHRRFSPVNTVFGRPKQR